MTHKREQHGMSDEPIYRSWYAMIGRCENPRDARFARYGGRGIKICKRWRESFLAFAEDMGDKPPGASLGRIDNDGDYEPTNCRWESAIQQANNKSDNVKITAFGRTLTRQEWSRETGLSQGALRRRINKMGWDAERALSTPADGRNMPSVVMMTAFGRTMHQHAWAREVGIQIHTIRARLRAGWPIELALTVSVSTSLEEKRLILRNQECIERAAMRPVDTSGIVPGAIGCRCPLELAWLSVGGQPRPAAEWAPE